MRYGTNDLNHYRSLLESFLNDRSKSSLTILSNKTYISTQKIIFEKLNGQLTMTTYDSSDKVILHEANISLYNAALQYQTVSDNPSKQDDKSRWYRSTTRQNPNASYKRRKSSWFSRENRYRRERLNSKLSLICFILVVLFVLMVIILRGGYLI